MKIGFILKTTTLQGFTLIELLVSLTLIMILSTVGVVGYRQSARKSAVDGVQSQIGGLLRQAQANAQGGKKINCAAALDGWQVRFTTTSATLEEKCGASVHVSTVITTPPSVTISSLPNPNPILFKVLNQGTNAATGIGISGFGFVRGITVSSGGSVSFTTSAPAPTASPSPTPGADNGVNHSVYIYAINYPSGTNNPLLNGSPKSVVCS